MLVSRSLRLISHSATMIPSTSTRLPNRIPVTEKLMRLFYTAAAAAPRGE